MVGNHDHALWKGELHQAIWGQLDLVGNRSIPTDAYRRRPPPLRHSCDQEAKGLLGEGHVGVEELAVDPVKRCSDELGEVDTGIMAASASRHPTSKTEKGVLRTLCSK